MAFDYKQYQQKTQNAIDVNKFLPTGQNLQNVQGYLGAENAKKKQSEIDKIVEERRKTIKKEMASEGVYTSIFRNAWEGIKSGEAIRDTFDKVKSGVSHQISELKKSPFEGLENKRIPDDQIPRNPLLDKKNVLPQVGERLFDEYKKVFGDKTVAERETEYAKNFTKEQKASIRKDWQDFQKENPELANSLKAKETEEFSERTAKTLTTPVKYTAGTLLTGITSYALERADSDFKYTPKTDAEKLLLGEEDIQRLTKQEDLYGMTARSLGIPAALTLMALLENPFMADTGLGKITKESLEKIIKKQTAKTLSKFQPEQIVKVADELIEKELKAGKIEKEIAEKAKKEINSVRVVEVADETPAGKITKESSSISKIADEAPIAKEPVSNVAKMSDELPMTRETIPTIKNVIDEPLSPGQKLYLENNPSVKVAPKTIEQQALDYNTASEYIAGIKNTKQADEIIDEFAKKYDTIASDIEVEQVLTDIFNKAKKADVPVVQKESIEKLGKETVEDGEKKVAKLATDTATKADEIEKSIGKDFEELAGYTARKVKSQSEKTAKLISEDLSSVRAMIRGEKEIPSDVSPAYLFKAMEDFAAKTNDPKIIRELSRSKIASDISQGASELRMVAERNEFSPTKIISDIKKARAKKAKPLSKRTSEEIVAKEQKAIKDKIRYEVKKSIKVDDWKKFIDEIRC
jgi:hypothetical protein